MKVPFSYIHCYLTNYSTSLTLMECDVKTLLFGYQRKFNIWIRITAVTIPHIVILTDLCNAAAAPCAIVGVSALAASVESVEFGLLPCAIVGVSALAASVESVEFGLLPCAIVGVSALAASVESIEFGLLPCAIVGVSALAASVESVEFGLSAPPGHPSDILFGSSVFGETVIFLTASMAGFESVASCVIVPKKVPRRPFLMVPPLPQVEQIPLARATSSTFWFPTPSKRTALA